MKLFLSSHYLEPKHFDKFKELLGKPVAGKALFITAAAVPYGLNPKPSWLEESLRDMSQLTQRFDETSLEEGSYIPEDVSVYDFIFISGGNAFYLAYRLAETKLDGKLKEYIKNDGLYVGSSAGAIILMDSIEPFASADDPEKAPLIYPGLSLIDFAVVPHADSKKYAAVMKGIANLYVDAGKEAVLLNDNQGLVVNGYDREVI